MVEVCENPDADYDYTGYEDRYMTRGATKENRHLSVIWSDAQVPIVRLITAFEWRG